MKMIIGLMIIVAIDHLMINMAPALTRSYIKMIIGMLINVVCMLKKVLEIKIVMTTMMIRFLIITIIIDFIDIGQAHSSVEKAGLIGLVKLR